MKKNIIIFLMFFISFSVAAQTTVTQGSVSGTLYSNVAYKTGSNLTQYEKDRCKVDIYIPKTAGKGPFPVVVFFHGGGLNSGDKTWDGWSGAKFGFNFLEAGVAMVMVNYRLSGQQGVKWPAYIQDAAASVAWVTNNIQNYGGDANNVFVMGFSAGAYLTQMLAVDSKWYTDIGFDRSRIRGYLPMSGQPRAHGTVAGDLGLATSQELMTHRPDAMPLGHVAKTEKPIHFFVGGNEGQTITDNYEFYNALVNKGSTDIFIYTNPGKDHPGMRDGLAEVNSPTRLRMIDFIRDYSPTSPGSSSSSSSQSSGTTYIQAETYSNMSGVTINSSTAEAGSIVGSIETNDWMSFNNVNIPTTGTYTIAYRVASLNGGGALSLEEAGGGTLYATTTIPKTAGWDIWTTVYQTVTLTAGNHNFGIKAGVGGWNLNWFSIAPASVSSASSASSVAPSSVASSVSSSQSSVASSVVTSSSQSSASASSSSSSVVSTTYIQAEAYSNMSGVVIGSSAAEAGSVVGSIDTNDWFTFNGVNIPTSGSYTIAYRVASLNGGGSLRLEEAGGGALYATTSIPKTNGWDTWTTVYQTVTLTAGNHNFGIKAGVGGWNLNWFSVKKL